MSGYAILAIVFVAIAAVAVVSHRLNVARRKYLIGKYGLEIAEKIIGKRVWQGMTSDQLVESWGKPADVDTKVYKQKTNETWKYGQTGKNRYKQRVFTENGIVVGWEQH